jgi:hypothetical protein
VVETVNVFVFDPEATVTEVGTVAAPVFPLESVTTFPPVGAFALSVTVPVEAVPPVTLVGLSEIDERFWAAPGKARTATATSSGRRPGANRTGFKTRSSSERRADSSGGGLRTWRLLLAQRLDSSVTCLASSTVARRAVKTNTRQIP